MFKVVSGDFPVTSAMTVTKDGGLLTWGWGKDKSVQLKDNVSSVETISMDGKIVEFSCKLVDGRAFSAKSDLSIFEKLSNLSSDGSNNLILIEEQRQTIKDDKAAKQQALMAEFRASAAAKAQQQADEKQEFKDRLAQYDREGIPYCPKCSSISLSANKKGFGGGKALVGALVTANPLGLLAGNIGKNQIEVTCLKCGYNFKVGKR